MAPGTSWRLGGGVAADVRRRWPWYADDWKAGLTPRLAAPALYIFFASVLPALAFGQQLATDTDGTLTVVHVLAATALAGLLQSLVGGQPLLIIGVAEPIVLIYGFLYSFSASSSLGTRLFLPWAAYVCVFTAVFCAVLALGGACACISAFTRLAGETFAALIAILFFQVGVKGMVQEFYPPPPGSAPETWQLTLINGLWSLLLAAGLLLTCTSVLHARAWRFGRAWLRGLLADYGVPLMVVAWSALSYAVAPAGPTGSVPRRINTPNTGEVRDTWSVASRMHEVPAPFIAAALLPAFIISVLFIYDHSVSSQLAQQPEFNLAKGSAYHYDLLLLAGMTLVCGLIGVPPVNGVLPQAPMHTRSLAHIRKRRPGSETPAAASSTAAAGPPAGAAAAQAARVAAASHSSPSAAAELRVSSTPAAAPAPHAAAELSSSSSSSSGAPCMALRHRSTTHQHPDLPPLLPQQQLQPAGSEIALNALPDSAAGPQPAASKREPQAAGDSTGSFLELEVREQRVTNLLQSLLAAACLGLTPVIQRIPTGVINGYFIFLAIAALDGSQLWERALLLLTDPRRRIDVLQREHAAYLQAVPFRVVVRFTLLQLTYLLGVWALATWAGVAGIAFPLPIMALVPLRQHVLPRLFAPRHLAHLDAAAYETAPPVPDRLAAARELYELGALGGHAAEPPAAPAAQQQLPVVAAAASAAAAGVREDDGGGRSAAAAGLGSVVLQDEGEIISEEFRGVRLVHHLARASLQQQPGLDDEEQRRDGAPFV